MKDLVAVLRAAYSGELAAGLAYRGHWKSLRDPDERDRIRAIEAEEWHHRALVGDMLAACGAAPSRARELVFWTIGRVLGALCRLSGWLAPMYGAGRLESRNVGEYETAARRAAACGRHEWIECLLTMAEVEWDHEAYFRAKVLSHRLGRVVPLWTPPAAKPAIRASFARDVGRICAAGVLVRRGEVLLAKRSPDRSLHPGVWDLLGGHCEPGEALGDTLRRELGEELGVRALAFEEVAVLGEPDVARYGEARYHVFAVTSWQGEPRIANGEHSELRWLPLDDALALPLAHPESGRVLRRAVAHASQRSAP